MKELRRKDIAISVLSLKPKTRINQKQECLYIFFLRLVALYFGGMRNSIDFCKGIFLHLIAVTLYLDDILNHCMMMHHF